MRTKEQVMQELKDALKGHDVTFEYSDDRRVWSAGADSEALIFRLMTEYFTLRAGGTPPFGRRAEASEKEKA